jgi:arylsulfatase A-like enzyme
MKVKLFIVFSFLLTFALNGQKKYNILWLVLEDQSAQFFPMYGDTNVKLPAIEALAAESIIFDNAFANVPVCAPARSTIILGMYPIKTGSHNMRTYNGYREDNQPTINLKSYTPVLPKGAIEFPKYLRREGYYCTNNSKEDYNVKITVGTWDESSIKAHWRKRNQDQPFFSIFNFNDCHESGLWKFGSDSLVVDPDQIFVPPYFPDDSVIRHDLAVNYSNLNRVDAQIGKVIQELREDGLYDDTYIFFYGDHGGPFPRHKSSLKETGLKVPFFVKLPKDLGGKMERSQDLISFIDLAPTVLSIIGLEKPEHMQGKAFLGKYVDEPVDFVFASSDRFDAIYDRSRAVRSERFKYIRNYRTDLPYALPVAYRLQVPMMKRWLELSEKRDLEGYAQLWMRANKEEEEFYDLASDPFELNNLINNEFYASEIARHKKVLREWMMENDDQGAYDERELIEKWSRMAASIQLSPPVQEMSDGQMTISNPNAYGNIVYKTKESDSWRPFSEHQIIPENAKYKIVHIGLEDSSVLEF